MLAFLLALLITPAQAQPAPGCVKRDVQITQSTRLDPNCRYLGMTQILASNVVLDCAGAVLDGDSLVIADLSQNIDNMEGLAVHRGADRNGIGLAQRGAEIDAAELGAKTLVQRRRGQHLSGARLQPRGGS